MQTVEPLNMLVDVNKENANKSRDRNTVHHVVF